MGKTVSIEFTDGIYPSTKLYSQLDGMDLVKKARDYIKQLQLKDKKNKFTSAELYPEAVMVDFIRELTKDNKQVLNNYYLSRDDVRGNNKDCGHHSISIEEVYQEPGILVTFKVQTNNSLDGTEIQTVTGELISETNTHIKVNNYKLALERGEDMAIRMYLKDYIIGEIVKVSND